MRTLLLFALAATTTACRDAPELLEPSTLPPLGPAPYRLTFDPGREASPSWSASGDEVIYIAEQTAVVPKLAAVALSFDDTRPDGSEMRTLPAGARPAWSADGKRVYYESDRRIWSVGVDGQGATVVPDSEDGYQPAVSPDGRWLAFTRIDRMTGASDIWIVELEE